MKAWPSAIGGILFLLLLWLFAVPKEHSFPEFLGWMGAFIAAVFAAMSAQATRETVYEMRTSRMEERRPELTLESGADYFYLNWPDTRAPANEQHMPRTECVNRNPQRYEIRPPFLLLENFGGGVALEANVMFGLADNNELPVVPIHYQAVPFGSHNSITVRSNIALSLFTPNGSLLTSHVKSTSLFVPHCGPGATRQIEIPRNLLWRIFLRALEKTVHPERTLFTLREGIPLTVKISYRSRLESNLNAEFHFNIRTSVYPDSINGNAEEIWSDADTKEIKVFFELIPKGRSN